VTKYNYIITPVSASSVDQGLIFDQSIESLVDEFSINSFFDESKHTLKLQIYSLDGTIVFEDSNYTKYAQLQNAGSAGKQGATNITIDPVKDAADNGFEGGDVNVVYSFFNNPFSLSKFGGNFFIESISPDRTEIRALSQNLTDQEVLQYTAAFKDKILTSTYFSEFYVNFKDNITALGINVESETIEKGAALVLKLSEPLNGVLNINDTFTVSEVVSDTLAYRVTAEIVEGKEKTKFLKGPNFYIELTEENKNSTEYFNYNELFSYPVTSSYYELFSLFNEKSAQIAIDHTDYSDFIHFSSAEERLRNFKYKLDLIHSHEDNLNLINSGSYSGTGISGSRDYYDGLIKGIVDNFDHYDRYLYFESGSNAWPKTTTTRPYVNQRSNTNEAITYFNNQITSASNYDVQNFDILINTIPTFIREDSNNEPYLMFVHMIAQHFDNLWIYFKAVSDKYDADNRLDFGVSKDLVRSAIESFGIKQDTSGKNNENLFSIFTGEGIITGSELITSQSIILSGSGNQHLQPVPQDHYQKEIYKRIYHNIPLLVKSKGTERGLRALINCYGIPDDILSINVLGGQKVTSYPYYGPQGETTSSLGRIRLDTTGSILTGSTLSTYAPIYQKEKTYSDDQNVVEVGFNLAANVDAYIKTKLTGSFNIDDYIGDPRANYSGSYEELNALVDPILQSGATWEDITDLWSSTKLKWDDYITYTNDPFAFIRLIKFFDTTLFRTIKQFLPGRAIANTGLIIKPHKLNRSKAKQVKVSYTNEQYTGSIPVATITGSDGGSFGIGSKIAFTTNYTSNLTTPIGTIVRGITDESPKLTGEFSGSLVIATDGELNTANPFKKQVQPILEFDITVFNLSLPIPPACIITLEGIYLDESFTFSVTGTGTIDITYPTTLSISGSATYNHDYDDFEYFTMFATPTYPFEFQGWYSTTGPNSGSLISNSNPISIYYENDYGGIQAKFIDN
tara:strand:+ start:4067 stop:6961 length:2895 start_codon:yes stop_codon:yes gene_type:complete